MRDSCRREYIYSKHSLRETIRKTFVAFKLPKIITSQFDRNIGKWLTLIPTTKKQQNRATRSRDAYIISNRENMDVLISRDRYEREDRGFGDSTRRPESLNCESLMNLNLNRNPNSRENEMDN